MRAARYITGWARLRVTGAEPERFLRALAERAIPFWDAAPPKDFALSVSIPARHRRLAAALAPPLGCEAEIVALRGLPAVWKRLRRRWLPAFLLAAVLLALAASRAYIWDVDITGNETVPDGVIRQALAECGVDIGERWIGMSQDLVRNGVLLKIPSLRWMTVTMIGSRAHVIVRERYPYIEPVRDDDYAGIVAEKAGLVTAVYALRGTAETEPGRMLLPGDTVIGGYATGRFGVLGPVRAEGWAEARTWRELTAAAPLSVSVKEPAGGTRTRFALILGKTRINFYKGSSICPAECDKIIERHALARGGVFTLPVSVETISFVPYRTEPQRAEELRGELEETLMTELVGRIGEEGEVASAVFTASEQDGMLYVTLHAECRERIGRSVPLTAEELWLIQSKIPQTEDSAT